MNKYFIKLNKQNSNVLTYQQKTKGDLGNFYSPLQNLDTNKGMGDFTTPNLNLDYQQPVELEITDEYDGSQNIILNDDINQPKLINSRFSVQENNTYLIPEHMGNAVNNIYEDSELSITSNLLKLYQNIPNLEFKGLSDGGSFKCGSYIFYFKLSDSNNNLTNIIQESGVVQVHVGQVGTNKVRMGLEDEDAGKNISFSLTGIDAGFDYVRVFYERYSTSYAQAGEQSYFMINQNFPINNGNCDILITGSEEKMQITNSDLQTEFADIQSAKTSAVNSNILFLGNISAYEQNFKDLQQIAFMITPSICVTTEIGEIKKNYEFDKNSGCYYNAQNVYDFTGYWPDEYYRFGICFIYDNNLVSPVFNIQGVDLSLIDYQDAEESEETWKKYFTCNGDFWENSPENSIFKKEYMTNSKGVVKTPNKGLLYFSGDNFTPDTMGIKFNLSNIVSGWKQLHQAETEGIETLQDIFKKYKIKGFFFTRQKRIPSIYAQGIVVGLTGKEYGSLPVIKDKNDYITKSFLHQDRLLHSTGQDIKVTSKVENKAVFVPDAELQEATYNQIFNGQEFTLIRIGSTEFEYKSNYSSPIKYSQELNSFNRVSKVTAVQKDMKILTDGENYFSTLAGDPSDPIKTSDVNYEWNKTAPQYLTVSTSLVRGKWGYYVGISNGEFNYGDIINIKSKGFADNADEQNYLEFQKRFNDYTMYSAIMERTNIADIQENMVCYRGDCFTSLFTHKVMNNFVDPEMPTNTKIIDPACWCNNYAVRCTATIVSSTHSNLTDDSSGWVIPSNEQTHKQDRVLSIIFGILTGNFTGGNVKVNTATQTSYANEVVQAFETKDGKVTSSGTFFTDDEGKETNNAMNIETLSIADLANYGLIHKVNPQEQENKSGINLKAIFKNTANWTLRGIASINRADVNAVSYAQWITFPICSSLNLAFRDVDFSQATEEAAFNKKRSFYPLEEMDIYNHLVESNTINHGAKKSIASIQKPAFKQVPFIKQEFFNRIYWSRPNCAQQFINSYRMIYDQQYAEYNKEWGPITKIVSMQNALLIVFQHGMGIVSVNTTPQSEQEQSPYLAFKSVLPSNVNELSHTIGSMWKDSIIKSNTGIIYGVDTVSRKIWRVAGNQMDFISDNKVNKFLNDFIDLSEFDFQEYIGHVNVKTHYNAFKNDIIFTFYRDKVTKWKLSEEQRKVIKQDFLSTRRIDPKDYITEINENTSAVTDIQFDSFNNSVIIKSKKADKIKKYDLFSPVNNNIKFYYNPQYDKNSEAIKYMLSNNAILDYNPDKNKWVSRDKSKEFNYEIFSYTGAEHSGQIQIQRKNHELNSDRQIIYTFKWKQADPVEYPVRKGQVYNELNQIVTPIKPVEWEEGTTWSLCYNEQLQQFTTFYDWYPLQSANIDNVFFSFDKDQMDSVLNKEKNIIIVEDPDIRVGGIQIDYKVYDIGKKLIDSSFSNKTKGIYYYGQLVNGKNPEYVWTGSINDPYKALCFYTKNEVEIVQEKGTKIEGKTGEYNYYIIYDPKNFTITFKGSQELDIVDIHLISSDYIKKNDLDIVKDKTNLNYYYWRNSAPNTMKLWKHGQAGLYNIQGKIKPTNWYGKQHEFNFEFIVNDSPNQQKVFNNLLMISNKAEPGKFEFEVVGEGYEWFDYKPIVLWANEMIGKENKFQNPTTTFNNLDDVYNEIIGRNSTDIQKVYPDFPDFIKEGDYYNPTPRTIQKLPYLKLKLTDKKGTPEKPLYSWSKEGFNDYWEDYRDIQKYPSKDHNFSFNCNEVCLVEDDQLNEQRVHSEQLGNNMNKYGRVRGNMQYLEDSWKVEIRPIQFEWMFRKPDGNLDKKKLETKNRDKYLKVKVRYSGEDLAIITAVMTLFDESYA